jgi:hypothetical protein
MDNSYADNGLVEKLRAHLNAPQITKTIEPLAKWTWDEKMLSKFEEFDKGLEVVSFPRYLSNLISERDLKCSVVYTRGGILRSVFSKVARFDKPATPQRETVAGLCIGLNLNIDEAEGFYNAAGYHLGKTLFIDKAIRFFVTEKIYDIDIISECFNHFEKKMFGWTPRNEKRNEEIL